MELKLSSTQVEVEVELELSLAIDYERFESDTFNCKSYLYSLNIHDARLRFKLVSFMTPTVKMNFQSDKKFANKLWSCDSCVGQADRVFSLGYPTAFYKLPCLWRV